MTLFQGYDGELRLIEFGGSGTTYYKKVLFCGMDFSGPVKRGKAEETLTLDRGTMSSDAHYIKGSDETAYGPLPITFTARLADVKGSRVLSDWLSGVTTIEGTTIHGWPSGHTLFESTSAVSVPGFADSQKVRYRVEILWDGTTDYGLRYEEVYFKPETVTIAEAGDSLTISGAGDVHGDVSRITAFTAGYTVFP